MKKILLVFGTRPEAIKMGTVGERVSEGYRAFRNKSMCNGTTSADARPSVGSVWHYADYDLNIMAPNQDLYDITSKVLLGLRDVLKDFAPDVVLVHGDTTTSMAASLAAFYRQIAVAHVEAGCAHTTCCRPGPRR